MRLHALSRVGARVVWLVDAANDGMIALLLANNQVWLAAIEIAASH